MSATTYPNPCNRCGFCCLAQPCPAELRIFGPRQPGKTCPALSFVGDVASCGVYETLAKTHGEVFAKREMGVGAGCCIKARAVIRGQVLDFASMPDELKVLATRQAKSRRVIMMDTKDN